MALNDASLVIAANAVETAITHMQANSGTNPGAGGTTGGLGTRVAVNGTVDADGDITWTSVAFTGLGASQAVGCITYWTGAGTGSPATGGTYLGYSLTTGDASANSAGEYTVTTVTESGVGV